MEYTPIQRTDKLWFICPYCGGSYRALAYHTTQKHGITAQEPRRRHGLKAHHQLITNDLKERHRQTALRDGMPDRLKEWGAATRYRKGHEGHTRDGWSPEGLLQLHKKKDRGGTEDG